MGRAASNAIVVMQVGLLDFILPPLRADEGARGRFSRTIAEGRTAGTAEWEKDMPKMAIVKANHRCGARLEGKQRVCLGRQNSSTAKAPAYLLEIPESSIRMR